MENDQNQYSEFDDFEETEEEYEPVQKPRGKHLAAKNSRYEEEEEYESSERPVARHSGKKGKSRKRKSRKKKTNWIMTIAMCALVVLILCLIFFLPKKSAVKTTIAASSTPAVSSDNGSVVIGQTGSTGTVEVTPVPEPTPTPEPQAKVNWKVGDTVKLGSFKQDKAGNSAPLEWTVLKREGNYALLISNKIVKFMKMYSATECSWEDSFIRDWLNTSEIGYGALYKKGTSFMGTAFTAEEQAALVALCDAPDSGVKLEDKVFLLSIKETKEYADLLSKGCYPTEYAVLEGQRIGLGTLQEGTTRWWWLRTTDYDSHFRFVNDAGEIGETSKDADNDYGGIRPAIWVDLTKVPA